MKKVEGKGEKRSMRRRHQTMGKGRMEKEAFLFFLISWIWSRKEGRTESKKA